MWNYFAKHDWVYVAVGETMILWTPVSSVYWFIGIVLAVAGVCGIGARLWEE